MKHQRRADLDVVRGSAILLAMGWHINATLTGVAPFDWLLKPGYWIGWSGVDVFFVLSGFLVGGMIFREIDRSDHFRLARFYSRRVWRLWPTLWAFIGLMLFADFVKHGQGMKWQDGLKIFLHVQNYFYMPKADHLWSLAVEEHFYVLVSLFLPLISRFGHRSRKVLGALAAIMLGSIALRMIGHWLGATPVQIQMQTQYRLDGLACGVLLAHLSLFRPVVFAKLTRPKWLWFAVSAGAAYAVYALGKTSVLGETFGLTASYVLGAALLLLAYDSGVERWASIPAAAFAFLGRIAYTLYLFHVPVFRVLEYLTKGHVLSPAEQVAFKITAYAASILLAWIVSIAIERPFMALRDRIFPQPSRLEPTSPPDAAPDPTPPELQSFPSAEIDQLEI